MKTLNSCLLITFGLWIACTSTLFAQDMGIFHVKGKAAREVGISHYRLAQTDGLVSASVFGSGGRDLAQCQVEFPERKAVAVCDLEEGGRYRWVLDKEQKFVTFEDLATGEMVTIRLRFTTPPTEGLVYSPPGEERPRSETEILIDGSKNLQEFDRDWGEASRLVALIVGEIMQSLDIRVSAQGTTPGASAPPQGLYELCDLTTNRWTCPRDIGFDRREELEPEDICCALASASADFRCRILTARGCCANTLCSLTCVRGICNCELTGYPFYCAPCD